MAERCSPLPIPTPPTHHNSPLRTDYSGSAPMLLRVIRSLRPPYGRRSAPRRWPGSVGMWDKQTSPLRAEGDVRFSLRRAESGRAGLSPSWSFKRMRGERVHRRESWDPDSLLFNQRPLQGPKIELEMDTVARQAFLSQGQISLNLLIGRCSRSESLDIRERVFRADA